MAYKQTAGRSLLGNFAPLFARLNDDVLFGEVWSRENKLSSRDRSIITVTALMSQGICDSSFRFHLESAKRNGISQNDIAEILTHLSFYVGWPKAWAALTMAKDVWANESSSSGSAKDQHQAKMAFPIGEPNDAYSKYFTGQSYLARLGIMGVGVWNVTFEPGCRNFWHTHLAKKGGGQILICIAGLGWYQAEGELARQLSPGDVVTIPAGVKHWHGATRESWFSHIALEVPGDETQTVWFDSLDENRYQSLKA